MKLKSSERLLDKTDRLISFPQFKNLSPRIAKVLEPTLVSLSWKTNLLKQSEIFHSSKEGARKFRTEVSAIPASSIAEQFFCERKVEEEYIHGEVETEVKEEGTKLHEKLLSMKHSTIKKIIKEIETRRVLVVSIGLAAKIEDLPLIGVPDAIIFQSGRPTHIIELKTTLRGDTTRIYDGQRAQALVYGLLLDLIGFDCSKLRLDVVRYRSSVIQKHRKKSDFLAFLVHGLLNEKEKEIAIKSNYEIVPHSFAFEKAQAIEILNRTKGYWLGQREPLPTKNPNKCRACEFKDVCKFSLAKISS